MAGNIPIKDDLILTRGADFVARYDVHPDDPDIGGGATARIEITETSDTDSAIVDTWDGVVSARYIEFRTESEDCDEIPAQFKYRLLVSLPDSPTLEHCWYFGSIKRKQ